MYDHFMECIDSLKNQTYSDVEIICVVDGNKEYFEMISDLEGVKLHLNPKNYGLLRSRNIGVELSSGDIVAFIDDDAIAERNWIEELVKIYLKMDAIAVGGKILPYWICKKPRWFPEEFYWLIGATHLGFPENVGEVRNTFGSNLSFRKDVFVELGGFNPKMGGIKGKRMLQGGETELCDRMRKRFGKGVVYNPNAIVYHKIFKHRTKIKFLAKRSFWQGYSKAQMEKFSERIEDEMGFLRFILKKSLWCRISNFLKGSVDDLLKFVFIIFFTSLVGFGYIYGKLRPFNFETESI